jgi:transcriptional regulator with XRE-family HTH domain
MATKMFWGTNGEYGPFTPQADGWPNAGEVVRYYRVAAHLSLTDLARKYGEATKTTVSKQWISQMERSNEVPNDITRRQALVRILQIPPILLGLGSLEVVTHNQSAQMQVPSALTSTSLDLEWYGKEARMLWQLHYAQTAQDALNDLFNYIQTLVPFYQDAKGSLARRLSELLNSYYRLVATILRDRGQFEKAYFFANESVLMASAMGKDAYASQITSASQYTRGVVNFAWGVFGPRVKQGIISFHKEKIEAALLDFEQASTYASPQLKGIIFSEMARAKALVAGSSTDITIALKLLEQAEKFLNTDSQDDFYTQILVNGDFKGLDKKRLILGRAKTFMAMKRPGKALDEFSELEMLHEGSQHTRRRGWAEMLSAQTAFDLGDFSSATDKALSALSSCQEANSITHLARINELHSQLLHSPYKNNSEVRRLGKLLEEIFPKKLN